MPIYQREHSKLVFKCSLKNNALCSYFVQIDAQGSCSKVEEEKESITVEDSRDARSHKSRSKVHKSIFIKILLIFFIPASFIL